MVSFLHRSTKCEANATICDQCRHHTVIDAYSRCLKDPTYHCDYIHGEHTVTYGGCEWKNYGRCKDFAPKEEADAGL